MSVELATNSNLVRHENGDARSLLAPSPGSETPLELERRVETGISSGLVGAGGDSKPKHQLNELHLFAGVGGGILGGILLGHRPVCAVEIEPYCREVLLQRQRDGALPWFPIWDDVRTFDGKPWRGVVDIVCGGFPCQDISQANPNAKGLEGARSGLWGEMRRIISEIRPAFVLVENSPMLVVRGLSRVVGDLAGMGYDSRWGVLRGDHAGVPQRRGRLWIVSRSPQRCAEGILHQNAFDVAGDREGLDARSPNHADAYDEDSGACAVPILEHPFWAEVFDGGRSGGIDGLADRVGREKATGNGQIPSVVALAFRLLMGGGGAEPVAKTSCDSPKSPNVRISDGANHE